MEGADYAFQRLHTKKSISEPKTLRGLENEKEGGGGRARKGKANKKMTNNKAQPPLGVEIDWVIQIF